MENYIFLAIVVFPYIVIIVQGIVIYRLKRKFRRLKRKFRRFKEEVDIERLIAYSHYD